MDSHHTKFSDWMKLQNQHIETVLGKFLQDSKVTPEYLHQAMRYAVLGGGKRIRAALIYATGLICNSSNPNYILGIKNSLDHAAAAIELIHAYSLVHDDLPCMDNAILRRGNPALHIKFGEAIALLTGDALQALAFEILAKISIKPDLTVKALKILASSIGSVGMVGGQAIDLQSVNQELSMEELKRMYSLKTGAVFSCCITLSSLILDINKTMQSSLDNYTKSIGLAFQIVDDILDTTTNESTLGKTSGKDALKNKPTYVSLLGIKQAKCMVQKLREEAHEALIPFGKSGFRLAEIADFIVFRKY
ncbi:MAG: polyprenyl synthetase family protein [Bordetella sp.]|nr:MAG: polyprenyl synthetase family protein [Bordetella sp.]